MKVHIKSVQTIYPKISSRGGRGDRGSTEEVVEEIEAVQRSVGWGGLKGGAARGG